METACLQESLQEFIWVYKYFSGRSFQANNNCVKLNPIHKQQCDLLMGPAASDQGTVEGHSFSELVH